MVCFDQYCIVHLEALIISKGKKDYRASRILNRYVWFNEIMNYI